MDSATGNGNLTALGSVAPTQHGHVWSTLTNPTTSSPGKTSLGSKSSTGTFTSNITGLSKGTTYYVRAYATSSQGTSYGDNVTFTTQGDDYAVTEAKAVLAIEYASGDSAGSVTKNIMLTKSGLHDTAVSWVSSNPNVILIENNGGTAFVMPPWIGTQDASVTVTATISLNNASDIKVFNLTVKNENIVIGPDNVQKVLPKTIHEDDEKRLTVIGTGFRAYVNKSHLDFKVSKGSWTGNVAPANVRVYSDQLMVLVVPMDPASPTGSYTLHLDHTHLTNITVNTAFEVTSDETYKAPKIEELELSTGMQSVLVKELKIRGKFKEVMNGLYVLDGTDQVVTFNSFLKFKGTELQVDTRPGSSEFYGVGRWYVDVTDKSGVTTTSTLHEGRIDLVADDMVFKLSTAHRKFRDYLGLKMAIGPSSMIFTDKGLRMSGIMNAGFDFFNVLKAEVGVDTLQAGRNPARFDMIANLNVESPLEISAFKAPRLSIGINTIIPEYSFGAGANIPALSEKYGFELDFTITKGMLNHISFLIRMELKIPKFCLKLTSMGGGLKNITDQNAGPFTLQAKGSLADMCSPEIKGNSLFNFNPITADLSAYHFEASGTTNIYGILDIAENKKMVVWNHARLPTYTNNGLEFSGKTDILGAVIGLIKAYYWQGHSFGGIYDSWMKIPDYVPKIGGQTLSRAIVSTDNREAKASLTVIALEFAVKFVYATKKLTFSPDLYAIAKKVAESFVAAGKVAYKAIQEAAKAYKAAAEAAYKAAKVAAAKVAAAAEAAARAVASAAKTVYNAGVKVGTTVGKAVAGSAVDAANFTAKTANTVASGAKKFTSKMNPRNWCEEEYYALSIYVDSPANMLIELNGAVLSHLGPEGATRATSDIGIQAPDYYTEYQENKAGATRYFQADSRLTGAPHHYAPQEALVPYDPDAGTGNLLYLPEENKVYVVLNLDQIGYWNVMDLGWLDEYSDEERSNVLAYASLDLYELPPNADMHYVAQHVIRQSQVTALEFEADFATPGRVLLEVTSQGADISIFTPVGGKYPLHFDSTSEDWNAIYFEDVRKVYALVNVTDQIGKTGWTVMAGPNDVALFTVDAGQTDREALQALLQAGLQTRFEITAEDAATGRAMLALHGATADSALYRPDGTEVNLIFSGTGRNADYQEAEQALYVLLDLSADQTGTWAVNAAQQVQVYVVSQDVGTTMAAMLQSIADSPDVYRVTFPINQAGHWLVKVRGADMSQHQDVPLFRPDGIRVLPGQAPENLELLAVNEYDQDWLYFRFQAGADQLGDWLTTADHLPTLEFFQILTPAQSLADLAAAYRDGVPVDLFIMNVANMGRVLFEVQLEPEEEGQEIDFAEIQDDIHFYAPDGTRLVLEFDAQNPNWNASYRAEDLKLSVITDVLLAQVGQWHVRVPYGEELSYSLLYGSETTMANVKAAADGEGMAYRLLQPVTDMGYHLMEIEGGNADTRVWCPDPVVIMQENEITLTEDNSRQVGDILYVLAENQRADGTWRFDSPAPFTVSVSLFTPNTPGDVLTIADLLDPDPDFGFRAGLDLDEDSRWLATIDNIPNRATAEAVELYYPDGTTAYPVQFLPEGADADSCSTCNALYNPATKQVIMTIEADAAGSWQIKTDSRYPVELQQLRQPVRVQRFDFVEANASDAENVYDVSWAIANPRMGSQVSFAFLNAADMLAGDMLGTELISGLKTAGTTRIAMPAGMVPGNYYLMIRVDNSETGPLLQANETPIVVAYADTPATPVNLRLEDDGNGEITLLFDDPNHASVTRYMVMTHRLLEGQTAANTTYHNFTGATLDVTPGPGNSGGTGQRTILSGLQTNETYLITVFAARDPEGQEEDEENPIPSAFSLPSNVLEVTLPEPVRPELDIAVQVAEGFLATSMDYNLPFLYKAYKLDEQDRPISVYNPETEEDEYVLEMKEELVPATATLINTQNATVAVSVTNLYPHPTDPEQDGGDQLAKFEFYLNDELHETTEDFARTAAFTLSNLAEGEHDFDIVAVNERGDRKVLGERILVDVTPPTLLLFRPTHGSVQYGTDLLVEGQTDPQASLTVNGQNANVDEDGMFAHPLNNMTPDEELDIFLVARDQAGNEARAQVQVMALSPGAYAQDDANLLGVELDRGELVENFHVNRLEYTITPDGKRLRIIPIPSSPHAAMRMKVGNGAFAPIQAQVGEWVDLQDGENTVTIEVTAQNGTTQKNYLFSINLSIYQVTASVVGSYGAVQPVGTQTVAAGQPITFTVFPDEGFRPVSTVSGTCAGTWNQNGNAWTIAAVNASCTAQFTFKGHFDQGDGSEADPYQVANIADLGRVRHMAAGEHFKLMDGLDLSEVDNWEPIGTNASPFNGIFNGNNQVLANVRVNRPGENNVGLFGVIGPQGQVRDLTLINVHMVGLGNVGGLAGENRGVIEQVHAHGEVFGSSGGDNVGGLVGLHNGAVSSSSATVDVSSFGAAGGLVGRSTSGSIQDCFATGAVGGVNGIGGLAGVLNDSPLTSSYSTGPVVLAQGGQNQGGLTGSGTGNTVTNSYWNTKTSSQSMSAHGTALTTVQMRENDSYTGWTFGTGQTWNRDDTVNGDYPYLTYAQRHTVSVSVEGNGSIQGAGAYPLGTAAGLLALPEHGHGLVSIVPANADLCSLEQINGLYIINPVTTACEVTATFGPVALYGVSYNGNGNTGGAAPTDAQTYPAGAQVTVAGQGVLEKTDAVFDGWNTRADGTGTAYASGATVTMPVGNVFLYAQWNLQDPPAPVDSGALFLNGVDQYGARANHPGIPAGNATYSWELWANAASINAESKIFSWGVAGINNSSVQIGFKNDGQFFINHWGTDWTTTYTMPTNTWVHLAGTYDGSTEKLYVNGQLTDETTGFATLTIPANGKLWLGNLLSGTTTYNQYFHGTLRDFRIWSTALDAATILAWKDRSATSSHPDYANLVSNYLLEAVSGGIAVDSRGGHDLTLHNGPSWIAHPVVTTQAADTITSSSVLGHASITSLGGGNNPTDHGICWSKQPEPTLDDSCERLGAVSATGPFTADISGLDPGTEYSLRAFATNEAGTRYGNQVSVTTRISLTMAASPGNLGSIDPVAGSPRSVTPGQPVSITAWPKSSANFLHWTASPEGNVVFGDADSAGTTATLTGPATVTAHFELKQYTLNYAAGTGGTIQGTVEQTVAHGQDGTEVRAVPGVGYSFLRWSDNATDNPRTDLNVTGAITVTALFIGNFVDGDGTEGNPYRIETPADLDNVRNMAAGDHFRLDADIDLSAWSEGEGWEPIGTEANPFYGFLDGNARMISNLTIDRPQRDNVGLFGVAGIDFAVTNLGLSNVQVTGRGNVGALVGRLRGGVIEQVHVDGEVFGSQGGANVGGLVGEVEDGIVRQCSSTADITSFDTAGGLVGRSTAGTIEDSFAAGFVGGLDFLGGLVGQTETTTITRTWAKGQVTLALGAAQDALAGGLIAQGGTGVVSHSHWDTETSHQSASAGGAGVTGLTTEAMRASASYNASWNFGQHNTWNRDDAFNGGYPYLTFAPRHDVTATITPEGSGTVTWLGAYPHGAKAILTVTPESGYSITSVTGDTEQCGVELIENVYTIDPVVTQCHVTATFSANAYTITFDSNGGTEVGKITQDFGTPVTAPAAPTREGHTFDGWNQSVPATMPAEDMTLTAQWTVNQYTITFDSEGGSSVASMTRDFGATVTAPADPTREGYRFGGWSPALPATMPARNQTVTALWTVNGYILTFDSAGGSAVTAIVQDYGTSITAPANPSRTGYAFAGWYPPLPTTMPAEDMTLTAQWTVNQYTITFDSDGGSAVPPITQDFGTPVTAPTDPTREGHAFDGWNPEVPETMPAGGATLTAQWTVNKYALTVTSGTGGGQYAAGAVVNIAANAPADGKMFDQWTGDTTHLADVSSASTTVTMPASNISVTATYTDAPVDTFALTVTNGTGSGQYAAGTVVDIQADAPADGKVFDKWTGDTAHVADVNSASTTVTMPAANVSVTATYTDAPVDTFALTVTSGTGSGQYAAGTVVDIAADAPADGKMFDQWTGDTTHLADVNSVSTTVTMPASNVSVTATYKDARYVLTVRNGVGSGMYLPGRVVGLGAKAPDPGTTIHQRTGGVCRVVGCAAKPPDAGMTFHQWTGDVSHVADVNSANTTLTMPEANVTVTATYREKPVVFFTLTVENGTGGGRHEAGQRVGIAANAAPDGQVFDRWLGDVAHVAGVRNPNTTVLMPEADVSLRALYVDLPPTEYDLTVLSGTGSGQYRVGHLVGIAADPAEEGRIFDRWTGNVDTVANVRNPNTTMTMPQGHATIEAGYRAKPDELFFLTVGSGTGSGEYGAGRVVAVSANPPASGRIFSAWTGDVDYVANVTNPNTTVNMPDAHIWITAQYRNLPAELYALQVASGSGSGTYLAGQSVAIAAEPAEEGMIFDAWTGQTAGVANLNNPNTTLTMPAAEVSLRATYRERPVERFALTVHSGTGSGDYQAGRVVNIAAEPAEEGMVFDAWIGQTASVANANLANTTLTMPTSTVTIRAAYRERPEQSFALIVGLGTGSGAYAAGQVVTIAANEAPEGQVFDQWTGQTSHLDNVNDPITTVTMPASAVSVTAQYRDRPVSRFTLTVTSGTGSGEYQAGRRVGIAAEPAAQGQVFDKWVGQTAGVANVNLPNTTLTMPGADVRIRATYMDDPGLAEPRELRVNHGTGSGHYLPGRVVSIAAEVREGFLFDKWTGQTASVANVNIPNTTVTMPDARVVLTATFKPDPEDLFRLRQRVFVPEPQARQTAAARAFLVAYADPVDVVTPAGRIVRLSAPAAPEGYAFDQWIGQTANMENIHLPETYVYMPDNDVDVTASYAALPEEATLVVEGGTGDGSYAPGTVVPIQAATPEEGMMFDKWEGQTAQVANVNLARTSLTMPGTDVRIRAVYRDLPADLHDLTVRRGSGSGEFAAATFQPIISNPPPDENQIFARWIGQVVNLEDINAEQTTVYMPPHDVEVVATYARFFTVSTEAGVGGAISPGSRDVIENERALFMVTPDAGYRIDQVSGCGGGLSGSTYTTGLIIEACTVTATFTLNTFTLTVTNGTGSGPYAAGTVVPIQANAPAQGRMFDRWTGDVEHVAAETSASTTVTMPAGNVAVTATYTDLPPVPTAIPTLSEWGLIIMSVLMLITGAIMYRRREQGLM